MASQSSPIRWTAALSIFIHGTFLFLLASAIVQAQSAPNPGTQYLAGALSDLCSQIQALIPTVAMLLVIVSGVVYAAGQVFGAETRARANVWAASCLTGAVIGILIAVVAPQVLGVLAGQTVSCG